MEAKKKKVKKEKKYLVLVDNKVVGVHTKASLMEIVASDVDKWKNHSQGIEFIEVVGKRKKIELDVKERVQVDISINMKSIKKDNSEKVSLF